MPRPVGLTLLSLFFMFGCVMAFLATVALAFPDGPAESLWRLNRDAQVALMELQGWGVALMLAVAIGCAFAAAGLWKRLVWGQRLALALLGLNLISDVVNAFVRGDLRTLIGVPIASALILYLLRPQTRAQFDVRRRDPEV